MTVHVINDEGVLQFDRSQVDEEIEFLRNMYEDTLSVLPPSTAIDAAASALCSPLYPSLRFDVRSSDDRRRILLTLNVPYGYPYVAPQMSVEVTPSSATGEPWFVPHTDVKLLRAKIHEAVGPLLPLGLPSLQQVVAATESFISEWPPAGRAPPPPPPPPPPAPLQPTALSAKTVKLPQEAAAASSNGGAQAASNQLKGMSAVRRLSALALHLLAKCCYLEDDDSVEEAEDRFAKLKGYLADSEIVAPEVCQAWKGERTTQHCFQHAIDQVAKDLHNNPELAIRQWFWGSGKDTVTITNAQSGPLLRYQNDFVQHRKVGSGGFAPVFVVRKKVDGKFYAVKKVAMRTQATMRALREVQTLASLTHDNVVRYYDAWVEAGIDPDLHDFIDEEEEEDEEQDDEPPTIALGSSGHSNNSDEAPSRKRPHHRAKKQKEKTKKKRSAYFSTSSDDDSEEDSYEDTTSSSSSCSTDDVDSDDDEQVPDSSSTLETPSLTPSLHSSAAPSTTTTSGYRTLYILMELCASGSLRSLMDSGALTGEAGEELAATILRQLLVVVAHVHSEGMVHRDLKPDNVLFGIRGGEPDYTCIKVADFGLARQMEVNAVSVSKSISGEIDGLADALVLATSLQDEPTAAHLVTGQCGTVLYCAPEQLHSAMYDSKVDEYSVGVIALEMWLCLAGKDFRERFVLLNQVTKQHGVLPTWFKEWNPKISSVIESLIKPNPTERLSCESLLKNAQLPGESPVVTAALNTFEQNVGLMLGGVMKRIQDYSLTTFGAVKKRTPPEPVIAAFSAHGTDVLSILQITATLHGAVSFLPFLDMLLPLSPQFQLGDSVPTVVDQRGRCYLAAPLAHYHIGHHLATYRTHGVLDIDTAWTLFNRTGRPTFNFLAVSAPSERESLLPQLKPLLYLLQLASSVEVGTLGQDGDHSGGGGGGAVWQVVLTRAQYLVPSEALCSAPRIVRTLDDIQSAFREMYPCVPRAADAVADEEDLEEEEEQAEWRELAERFLVASQVFHSTTKVQLVLRRHHWLSADAVCPVEALRTARGSVAELRVVSSKTAPLSIAIACPIDPYVACFSPHHPVSGTIAAVDIFALLSQARKVVNYPTSLQLEAVMLGRGHAELASGQDRGTVQLQVVENACRLVSGGIRVRLRHRIEKDPAQLCRFSRDRHIGWWLQDTKLLTVPATPKQTKIPRIDVAIEHLASDVRMAAFTQSNGGVVGFAGGSTVGSSSGGGVASAAVSGGPRIDHLPGQREDASASQLAKDLFSQLTHPMPNHILLTPLRGSEIRAIMQELLEAEQQPHSHHYNPNHHHSSSSSAANSNLSTPLGGGGSHSRFAEANSKANGSSSGASSAATTAQHVLEWLRKHSGSCGLTGVYSLIEERMEFFVNNARAKTMLRYREKKNRKSDRGR